MIWPNWVDLIIVSLTILGCYRGFGRGFLAELFRLAGVIAATVLAANYHALLATWLGPWIRLRPTVVPFVVFSALVVVALFILRIVLRWLTAFIQWERLHWSIQGVGMMLGGFRGLWLSGLILLWLVASGWTYLIESVRQRSLFGPQLLRVAEGTIGWVADRAPGAKHRIQLVTPIPVTKPVKEK